MSRKKKPGCWNHKPSGQVYVRIYGQDHYLGPYDSPESRDLYDEIIRDWTLSQSPDRFTLRLDELALRYLRHCRLYYSKNGSPTTEVGKNRDALKLLVKIAGRTRVSEFGPQKLLAVRDEMIGCDWRRITINQQIGRIRRCFKWGVLQELISPEVLTVRNAVVLERDRDFTFLLFPVTLFLRLLIVDLVPQSGCNWHFRVSIRGASRKMQLVQNYAQIAC